jgi:transposase
MPSITKQHMGQYIYLYESTSHWDKTYKRPENYKNSIGRTDTVTGETFYKQQYIDKLKREGKSTENMLVWVDGRRGSVKQISLSTDEAIELAKEILDTVKDYGVAYFLQSIAEKIGLLDILEKTIPQCWKKIFVLACYLVASDKSMMYCADWAENNECVDAGNMTSQRISELLTSFGFKERTGFYQGWYSHIRENEYIALDITSVSSYAQNIDFMEWGYNRDGENLPQVNICMLFGEKSKLPIYQTLYNGSLKDVSTLEATLTEFSALTGTRDIMLVMDKGFFSTKNTNMLLRNKENSHYQFILPVSFTSRFAKDRVAQERDSIDNIENVILTGSQPIRGVHRLLKWGNTEVHTHVFFNPEKALKERNELYGELTRLKVNAMNNPDNKNLQKEFMRYLTIDRAEKPIETVSVSIRKDIMEQELNTTGWFVLISNQIEDTQTAYDLYRAKDVVEKSFFQYKNNLGLNRFHVHSDERVLNKTFAAFIALILTSHIHNVMKEKQLNRQLPFDKLLSVLMKLKAAYVRGIMVLRPLTKEQKLIFKCFDIAFPGYAVE